YQGRYLSIKETSVFILLLLLFWLIFLTKLLIYFASCKLTIAAASFFVIAMDEISHDHQQLFAMTKKI
ncbi:hypothetical protein OMO38_18860, partial [Chryseobacterium sp. 09-1422]